MKVILADTSEIILGTVEVSPTIGIIDYSRRVTDDFGTTTVVERGFAQRMSVRLAVPTSEVDALQQTLASLRATQAEWVVDEDSQWLSVTGFYKSFDVDIAIPPLSYCTLTIEGLAGTAIPVDPGGDPAPDGAGSTLRLLQPIVVTDAALTSSNIIEADYPAWSIGTTYGINARIILSHRIFQSIVSGNIGHDPLSSVGKWVDVGPTNRWAMFDQALGTVSSRASSIAITVNAGSADAIALLDVVGATVRVQATGYDETLPVVEGAILFLDFPAAATSATVTIAGSGTVEVGTFLIGHIVDLGTTEGSPTAGINDFSRKEFDEFGEPVIVERSWTKRMEARALIRSDAIDKVANRIASVRAVPSLWIGDTALDSLILYGFFKDFSIEVGEVVSKLTLTVEGLSEAPEVSTLDLEFLDGEDGAPGLNQATIQLFRRSATTPALPNADLTYTFATGAVVGLTNGWEVLPQAADGNPLWRTQAVAISAELTDIIPFGELSTPAIFAQDGGPGVNQATVFIYQRAATTPALPSATTTYTFATGELTGLNNGWGRIITDANGQPLWSSQALAINVAATDSIPAGEWQAAAIMAQDGATGPGGAGAPALEATMQPPAKMVPSYSNGAVKSWAGITTLVRIYQGTTDVSVNFNLSPQDNPQGLTTSINNSTKVVTVTGAMSGSGQMGNTSVTAATLTIRATGTGTFAGIIRDVTLSLSKLFGGGENVSGEPDTDLYEGREIYDTSDGQRKTYKPGLGWRPAIDVDSAIAAAQLEGALKYEQLRNLLIGDFSNLAVNGDMNTGTLEGWTRIMRTGSSFIGPATSPSDLSWPSTYALRLVRAVGDTNELSIVNGLEGWDPLGLNAGISLEPGDELQVEMIAWTTNGSTGFYSDCIIKTNYNVSSIAAMAPEAIENCVVSGGSIGINPGQTYSPIKFRFKNTTGIKGRAWVRIYGPGTQGAEAYLWNLKINRVNAAALIVRGGILADQINASVYYGDEFNAGVITAAIGYFTQLSALSANIGEVTAGILRSFSGGAMLDLDNARLHFNNGSVMKVTGLGFGSANQFIEWSGPSQASLSTCTEANAISYIKTNGDAYFGGTLSSGVLRNAAQTTILGSGAEVVVGPFGTNGDVKTVVLSFVYTFEGLTSAASYGSDTGSATLVLERSVDGGAWTTVTTLSVTGGASWSAAGGGVPGSAGASMTGSTTATDTLGTVTGNFRYRGRFTAVDYPSIPDLLSGATTQNISIVSTEA